MPSDAASARPGRHGAEQRPGWFIPVQFALGAALVVYAIWLTLAPDDYVAVRDLWLFTGILVAFAAWPFIRAGIVATDRLAWLAIGVGMLLWAAADAYYTFVVGDESGPYPYVADAGYLSFFVFAYAGVILLLIGRTVNRPVGAWVDGILVLCGAAALLFIAGPYLMGAPTAQGVALVLDYASPVGDLVLLCLLVAILGVLGRRAGLVWWILAAGAGLLWVADSLWLLATGTGSYQIGAPLDLMWLLAFGCFGTAAWLLPVPERRVVEGHVWSAVAPLVTTGCFLLLLAASRLDIPTVSVALAAVGLVLGLARTGVTLRASSRHAEIVRQAHTDDLTGLANRRKLAEEVGSRPTGALALIDIDGFRQVNDSLGHLAGDELLRTVAPRLQQASEGHDAVLARLGGDEFALFLRGPHQVDHALEVGERVRAVIAEPMRISDIDLQIDMSVGIALAPQHGDSLEELLRAADAALYRAQHTKAGVTVFEPGLDSSDRGHLIFLQELRQAIAADELFCVYQPKIDTGTGCVAGVEALVRWRHPERGEIGPAEFLAFAERTALIRPLARRVLHLAIQQLREWRDAGLELTMSVNLSTMNLLDPHTPVVIAQLLAEHHLPADRLILEITESVFLADARRGREVLQALQRMGCQISIDDYGTGFSSLEQIQSLPAQELKLDSSFVAGVARRPQLQSIVSASVLLARGLGMSLVAEGVESEADLQMVTRLGCDLAQGFLICPPLAPLDAGIWLRRRPTVPRQRIDRTRQDAARRGRVDDT